MSQLAIWGLSPRYYFVLNGFINGDADAYAIPAGGGDDPPQPDGWYFFANDEDADGTGPFQSLDEVQEAAWTFDKTSGDIGVRINSLHKSLFWLLELRA